jgi:uncharacterized membrane protein
MLRVTAWAMMVAAVLLFVSHFAHWWPYTHHEDAQFTVVSPGRWSVLVSGYIPLPLAPALLLAAGGALWFASRRQERREK